jgi:GTP-binding protein
MAAPHDRPERGRNKGPSAPEPPPPPTRFVASAPAPDRLPYLGLPEVGFVGRSNVGKSSLLGMALGQPKLVRTSRTPGRTQALNLFVLEDKLALVDLPGYGFAKLPKDKRDELGRLIASYVKGRDGLAGLVLLVDARRDDVSALDVEMVALAQAANRPLLVVVTKSDLIGKQRLRAVVRDIEKGLGVPEGCAIPCSSHSGEGRHELLQALFELRR